MRSWKRLGFPKQVSRFKRFTGLPGFTWVCLGLPGFAPVPGLAFLGRIRITLHLSPTCLPLVLHLSHSWCSGPHDSTLVSDLCPIRCCELLDATLVSHCLPVPHLSSTCLQLGFGRKKSFASTFLPLSLSPSCLFAVFCLCPWALLGMEEFHLPASCFPFFPLYHFCLCAAATLVPGFVFLYLWSLGGQKFGT